MQPNALNIPLSSAKLIRYMKGRPSRWGCVSMGSLDRNAEIISLAVVDGNNFELGVEEQYPIELATPDQLIIVGSAVASRPQPVAFTVPSKPWVINHNLGYQPQVTVTDNLGTQVVVETTITSNQIVVNHNQPATGFVIYT